VLIVKMQSVSFSSPTGYGVHRQSNDLAGDPRIQTLLLTMEQACRVIEQEIGVLNGDIRNVEDCSRRHSVPQLEGALQTLYALRDAKKGQFRRIVEQLEDLKREYDAAQSLFRSLNSSSGTASSPPSAV
jgi:hypothetical protein